MGDRNGVELDDSTISTLEEGGAVITPDQGGNYNVEQGEMPSEDFEEVFED